MKRKILLAVLTTLLLAGCANQPMLSPLPASRTPSLQATPTPTITIPPEPTLTVTPGPRFARQCLPVEDREVELKEVAFGTTLLFYFDPNLPPAGRNVDSLKDIQTGNEYKLPFGSAYLTVLYSNISPNGNMVAQMERDINDKNIDIRDILWIFDAQAKVLSKITFNRTDLGQPRWLDNERLLIDTEKYGTLLLVNPFTKEQRVIADELPNPYKYFEAGNWWPVVYSTNLEWVSYYSKTGPVVYDLATKQILWKAGTMIGDPPVWSPNGQEVALNSGIGEYQLYIIKRSGQSKAVLDESLPHKAHAFSWSPDGRYIAFWNDDSLVVYDRQMDWVFDTCIAGGGGAYLAPLWSPDSQQMIAYYSNPHILILVDWQKKVAYKIKDIPNTDDIAGWMNSLP